MDFLTLAGIGTFTSTVDSKDIVLDARGASLYGHEAGPFRGDVDALLVHVHAEDQSLARSAGAQREDCDGGFLVTSQPFRIVDARGEVRHWLQFRSFFVPGQQSAPGVVFRVDERMSREAELALLRPLAERAHRLEFANALAAPLAHDLANMLTVIVPTLACVAEELPATAPSQAFIGDAVAAGDAAARLARQLVGSVRREADVGAVDVREEVETATRLVRRNLPTGVALDVEIAPDLPPVWCARGTLTHIVMNLAVNASDALRGRGGRITVQAAMERGVVKLSVADDGPGIPAAILEKVGVALVSTKGQAGTGLGLYRVRAMAQEAGGTFLLQTSGDGTCVTVELPVASASAVAPTPSGRVGEGRRVLLVDDRPSARPLEALVRSLGFRVDLVIGHRAAALHLDTLGSNDAVVLGQEHFVDGSIRELLVAPRQQRPLVLWIGVDPPPDGVDRVVDPPFTVTELISGLSSRTAPVSP